MDNLNSRPHIVIKEEPLPPKKREYEGGGGGVYERTSYQTHAKKISTEASQLKAIFAQASDEAIGNRYLKLALPMGQKVLTSTGKIVEENTFSKIVGSPSENIAHISISKSSFDDLSAQLARYSSTHKSIGKSKFAIIEEISEIPFDEKVSQRFLNQFSSDNEEGEVLVSLFPDLSESDVGAVVRAVKAFLDDKDGELITTLSANDGALLKIKSKRSVLKELAKNFVSIQSVDTTDEIIIEMASEGESVAETIPVNGNDFKAHACMFDTGINVESRFLKGSIIANEMPFGPNHNTLIGHGTFVASRIIYGDSIKDQLSVGVLTPDVKVLSVCINKFDEFGNKSSVPVDELIPVIRRTVESWHSQIRVYNLSISCTPSKAGASPVIQDDVVHILASEIDSLSRKYDVLFVLCTGNIPYSHQINNPVEAYPDYFSDEFSRIMSPAESMLGLTVGSVALEDAKGSMAKRTEPSPFTRRGPGFAGHHKPDLVAHGGNCGNNWSHHDFLNVVGFSGAGNRIAYGRGTSYSAPIITRYAAKLFEIMPKASACLVKAMLIHFCERPDCENFPQDILNRLHGHGIPEIDKLASSTRHDQSFIYEGEMDFRDMIEVPFYVPSVLVNRQIKEKVRVKVTITFFPETNSLLKNSYCKSHIRTKIIKLNESNQPADVSFGKSSVLEENRYSTVIKMDKLFSKQIASGEWKILIAHESRFTLKEPKTKFAVVITIEDPKSDPNIDIYSAIRNECPNKFRAEMGISARLRV